MINLAFDFQRFAQLIICQYALDDDYVMKKDVYSTGINVVNNSGIRLNFFGSKNGAALYHIINSSIYSGASNDLISVSGALHNVIVNVGEGSILLKGAATSGNVTVNGQSYDAQGENDFIHNTEANVLFKTRAASMQLQVSMQPPRLKFQAARELTPPR